MAEKVNYQQLSQQLETILDQLQSGDLDIDASIVLYEQGQKIVKQLKAHLDQAENKIKKLPLGD